MSDIAALVEAAKAKGTFNVLDAAKGRGYPQDIVTVYTDTDIAYKIKALHKSVADELDDAVVNAVDEQIKELQAELKAGSLTFLLRGIAPGAISSIQEEGKVKYDDIDMGPGAEWCNFSFLAAHIVSVTNADNAVDEHHWTVEEVQALHGLLPAESFQQLMGLMYDLTFASAYFDASVTADFLSNA